jgi:hypothetical protein
MRYSVQEIEEMAWWEINEAIMTWMETANFKVRIFFGGGKKKRGKSKSNTAKEIKIDSSAKARGIVGLMNMMNSGADANEINSKIDGIEWDG